jgi:RNA polymerase sigma factor (sigma-70 family)
MISTALKPVMEHNDTELVSQSLAGSREAFGWIVERYQSLICSVAYSATGSLTQSEDMAQETFVIAWKQLQQLREPEKLRSWLCSIARSVISSATRRQTREPAHGAEMLDTVHEFPALDPIPSERAINLEEEAILWRSLEQIPHLYREPLVLFYREQQSITCVAEKLELSEDAVKQRLSRGRKLLTEEVMAFVEGTLQRTNPGKAFTLGVLAALPLFATSAKAAAIGATAAKGSVISKSAAAAASFGFFFAPVIGVLAGALGTRIGIDSARSSRDRQFRIKMARIDWSLVLAFNVLFFAGIFLAGSYWKTHTVLLAWTLTGLAFGYGILIVWLAIWSIYRQRRIGLEELAKPPSSTASYESRPIALSYEYRSRWTLFGWPLIHIRFGGEAGKRLPAKGWIACGNVAYGILFASGRVAVGGVSIGGIALGGVAIGGCALGLLTFGGMAFGIFAMGGAVLGYMTCGAAAIAWLAACGGAAVAHDFALGGVALAHHVNDETARDFMRNSVVFSYAYPFMNLSILFACLSMAPDFLYWRKQSRRQRTRH